MILFFKRPDPNNTEVWDTTVILDYTRSDDQYSMSDIAQWTIGTGGELSIFSLNYSVHYSHAANTDSLDKALKTSVEISISNAPAELSALLNLQQLVGQESVLSILSATKRVIDAEVQFPRGVFVFPGPDGSDIYRNFVVYSTNYNFDSKRVNSTFIIRGASFDSMVMRLNFAANLDRSLPLISQVTTLAENAGYKVAADASLLDEEGGSTVLKPIVSRYYPPAPLTTILGEICRDNGLFFDLDEGDKLIVLKLLDPDKPPLGAPVQYFSFRGTGPGNLISTFSIQDYATMTLKSDVVDLKLFDKVAVYDDSSSDGLFGNMRSDPLLLLPTSLTLGYPFYVLGYDFRFDAQESTITIRATNNWVLSNFRLDTLFENAVYQAAAK